MDKIILRDIELHKANVCPKCKRGKLLRNALMDEKKLGYITYQCGTCNYHIYQYKMRRE